MEADVNKYVFDTKYISQWAKTHEAVNIRDEVLFKQLLSLHNQNILILSMLFYLSFR